MLTWNAEQGYGVCEDALEKADIGKTVELTAMLKSWRRAPNEVSLQVITWNTNSVSFEELPEFIRRHPALNVLSVLSLQEVGSWPVANTDEASFPNWTLIHNTGAPVTMLIPNSLLRSLRWDSLLLEGASLQRSVAVVLGNALLACGYMPHSWKPLSEFLFAVDNLREFIFACTACVKHVQYVVLMTDTNTQSLLLPHNGA